MTDEHFVCFYDDGIDFIGAVAQHLCAALASGGSGLCVATAHHAPLVKAAMGDAGIDVAAQIRSGSLAFLDAVATLGEITDAGIVDESAFLEVIGDVVENMERRRPLHIYGEMVAVLWDEGHVPAALALERAWNTLGRDHSYSLMCGYPSSVLAQMPERAADVCHLHTSHHGAGRVGASLAPVVEMHLEFPALGASPGEARRAVAKALSPYLSDEKLADVALVVSELAANAVLQSRSGFVVSASVDTTGQVRVSVADSAVGRPSIGTPQAYEARGRGLALVDALSGSWGVASHPLGKAVWAWLPRSEAKIAT
ncbi:MAG: MEDS domain-containing protein [Acidimicrobiales bacterium]